MARPRKKVDEELLKKLASIHCTMKEMSSIVGVSVDTLEIRYSDLIKKARENGKMSLRRWQFELAAKHNLGMLIWLGKQLLNQSEKVDHTVNHLPVITKVVSPDEKQVVELGAKFIDVNKDEEGKSENHSGSRFKL